MEIEELIKEAAVLSGFEVYDDYERLLRYQLEHGQYEWLEHEGKTIGFFGWFVKEFPEGLGVAITNMFVIKEHRKHFNIFDMCRFMKQRYPSIYKLEWHSQKKDKFKVLILKGRTI